MRRALAAFVLVVLLLTACGSPSSRPAAEPARDVRADVRTVPITDLRFKDHQLDEIASNLVLRAQQRGIEVSSGRNRAERLMNLEASLGDSTLALERVNSLARQIAASDTGKWAKLRQRADNEFHDRDDAVSRRVLDLLKRWQLAKSDAALSHLSSSYTHFIGRDGWERKFYELVSARPADAATWAWLIRRYDAGSVQQQYRRVDSETAYRFYLELTRFGDAREARRTFSVPGIEIVNAP